MKNIIKHLLNKNSNFFTAIDLYSYKIHLKIEKISSTRIIICSIFQFILYVTFYVKIIASPGDVYDISGWMTGLYIALLLSIVISFREVISTTQEKIGASTKNILSLAFLTGIYFCSAVGSATLNEIFPFSSSNTKYALAVATFMTAGYILVVLSTIFFSASLVIISPYFSKIYTTKNSRNDYRAILVAILFTFNLVIPIYIINTTNVSNFNNFLLILISRIAIDYDSMSPTLCLTQNTINELQGKNGKEYWVASIPVSTAVDSGYIVMALRKIPVGKKIQEYTEFDKYQYMPTTLYKVSCDQRNNTNNILDTY